MPPKKRKAALEAKGSSTIQEVPFKRPASSEGVADTAAQDAPFKRPASSCEGGAESTAQEAPFIRSASSFDGAAESAAREVPLKRPASSFETGTESAAQEAPFKRSASGFEGVATKSVGAVDTLGQLGFSPEEAAGPDVVADAQPERPAATSEEAASKQPVVAPERERSSVIQEASEPAVTSEGAADDAAPGAPAKPPGATPQGAAQELASALHETGWRDALQSEFEKPYFAEIAQFVAKERSLHAVYPPPDKVFEALNLTPLSELKVVILGQDPYHEPGQAHGLCFSVPLGIPPPASLKNIYKELAVDVPGFRAPAHGLLAPWAQQGVLLLNATLTVRGGHKEANSHAKCGWQRFTDAVISVINKRCEGVVFLLWGGFAQKKGKLVDRARHRVIETAHPSPLSARKWHGCKTFSKCNKALKALGRTEIEWRLEVGLGGREEKQTKLTALKGRSVVDVAEDPEGGSLGGQTELGGTGAAGDEKTGLALPEGGSAGDEQTQPPLPQGGMGGAVAAGDRQTGPPLLEGASGAFGNEQMEPSAPKGGSGAAGDEQTSPGGDTQTQPALLKGGCSGGAGDEQAESTVPQGGSSPAGDEQVQLTPQKGGPGGAGDKQIKLATPPGRLDGSGKKQTTLKFA